jgi:hypothetical protein
LEPTLGPRYRNLISAVWEVGIRTKARELGLSIFNRPSGSADTMPFVTQIFSRSIRSSDEVDVGGGSGWAAKLQQRARRPALEAAKSILTS